MTHMTDGLLTLDSGFQCCLHRLQSRTTVIYQLDEEIMRTTDLCDLNNLLTVKLNICQQFDYIGKTRCDFSFLFTEQASEFDLVLEVLGKAFQVCDNTLPLLRAAANYIENSQSNVKNQCIIIKLLKLLFSYFSKEQTTEILFENLKPEFVCNFLLSALKNVDCKAESYKTLISSFALFPQRQQIDCINQVFQFGRENCNLDILCALVNTVSDILLFDEASCFINGNTWSYVAFCLSGFESHLQKQGAYILSRCANTPTGINRVKCFNCPNREISWRAFFILIEIGREKQLHLVEPALNLFKHADDLPFIWQKCIYKIYLHHTQSVIVYRIAIHVLKQSFAGSDLQEMITLVFQAINKNQYNALSCKMFQTLGGFCSGLEAKDLEIIAKEFTTISWNVVSFWKTIQSILTGDNRREISATLCQDIMTSALNLPHVYIRDKCVKFLLAALWDGNDYEKVFKLVYSVALNQDYVRLYCYSTVSESVIQSALADIVKCNIRNVNFRKMYTLFAIVEFHRTPVLKSLQIQPIINHDISLLGRTFGMDVALFMLMYFSQHLHEESADTFLQMFTKDQIRRQEFLALFERPELFSDSQLYVALVLASKHLHHDIEIVPKLMENSFGISIIKSTNEFVIKSTDWKVCRASLDFICNKGKLSLSETQNAIQVFQHLLDSQPNNVLPKLYETVHKLLRLTEAPQLLIDFAAILHQHVFQIKKDQYYKDILSEFIKIVYSETFIRFNSDGFVAIGNDLVRLAESCSFLRFVLITQIGLLDSGDFDCYVTCLPAIADLYGQGTIVTSDERTHFYMCQEFIDDEQGSNAHSRLGNRSNPNLQSAASRLYALKNLLAIGKREPELVLNILQERYKLYFKKRYFPDSKIHYEKLRILQAMLLLVSEKGFPEDLRERTSCFVLKNLQEESNQNCIKQILNCILIFLLKDVFLLIKWMKSIPEMSPAVLISVVPAIYHLTLLGDENALQAVVEVLLPWTMGPQLKSRVYSQVCIQRLIEHGRKMKYTTFVSRNEHLAGCIDSVLKETGAIYTNTLALDLIVLKYFHPHQHVPWLCLFCDLPRLNKVGQVEWQNLQFLLDNSTSEIYIDKLQHIEFCKATETFSTRKTVCDSLETNENMNGMSQLQTKIVPWKTALDQTSTEANSDFILVASLIDKAQNLGGLSRTCEVFGIQNVVFHNAKITDEKEFKSLSMSSESWINRFEVKVKDLRDYLWALKSQSYRIIGAEQTVGSQQLDKFSFPRKIALVLGNEKTGIPPDIIPLLDTCLEIPQFGLTRSLNVHVAGAMFMWEFVKQHGRKPSVD
ncbi:uncharacterized protein LOC109540222 isoform X2 [Dendroctonus ponderosae]|uniref:uncharacterized protein LOC109540222 isoform X2 n=1 Tax=Dendroctonus ponderosae TaxID=77166 RepID=UPI0020355A47|nr:uncharacterized protein LOC109540222 isoform X2 [Dendroctonus ponderosae]